MRYTNVLAAVLVCIIFAFAVKPAQAAINSMNLGASYNAQKTSITFRVYSSQATRIELDLYASGYGVQESATYVLSAAGGGVWSTTVPVSALQSAGITGPVYYGYRAWGPNWTYSASWTKGSAVGFVADVDANGNRFNPNKLLLDPYAREVSQDPLNASNQDATKFATGTGYRNIDSGTYASKGIVLAASGQGTGTKPTRAQKDDVIYEVHARGFTMQDSSIAAAYRGTYKGAGLKAGYLASLGVTAVEFLPVQETQNDANDVVPNSDVNQNYWGYMTEDYFAPDRRYAYNKAAGGPTAEFQAMVQAFHNAGIKVYIDVVYNHTSEGGTWSGTDPSTATITSWRGLDNKTYYELAAGNQYFYDNTGTGANFNTYNTVAQNLIVDSLAYWSNTMGVDGFRFDLAAVLGNTCTNGCFTFSASDPNVAINRILHEFTVRPAGGGSGVDLFAEPWAASGNNAYQLGAFPARLVGMERPVSRQRAPGAERTRRHDDSHNARCQRFHWLIQSVPGERPRAVELDELHRRARWHDAQGRLFVQRLQQQPGMAVGSVRRRHVIELQLGSGHVERQRQRFRPAPRRAHGSRVHNAFGRHTAAAGRRRASAHAPVQQQRLQPRLVGQLAQLHLEHGSDEFLYICTTPDRVPQGASGVAPGHLVHRQRSRLVPAERRRRRQRLLEQHQQLRDRLHAEAHGFRRREFDVHRVQRLVGQCRVHLAAAADRHELVSGHGYVQLE